MNGPTQSRLKRFLSVTSVEKQPQNIYHNVSVVPVVLGVHVLSLTRILPHIASGVYVKSFLFVHLWIIF